MANAMIGGVTIYRSMLAKINFSQINVAIATQCLRQINIHTYIRYISHFVTSQHLISHNEPMAYVFSSSFFNAVLVLRGTEKEIAGMYLREFLLSVYRGFAVNVCMASYTIRYDT